MPQLLSSTYAPKEPYSAHSPADEAVCSGTHSATSALQPFISPMLTTTDPCALG